MMKHSHWWMPGAVAAALILTPVVRGQSELPQPKPPLSLPIAPSRR